MVSLHKQLEDLEQDWDAYKRSAPSSRRRRRSRSTSLSILTFDDSPKRLVSSLQQTRSPSQIAEERREPLLDGILRGRKLLEALDFAKHECNFVDSSCITSCSTVDDDAKELLSSSSSASSELIEEEEEKEVDAGETVSTESEAKSEVLVVSDGRREKLGVCKMIACLILLIAVVLLLLMKGFVSFRKDVHAEEVDDLIVPT